MPDDSFVQIGRIKKPFGTLPWMRCVVFEPFQEVLPDLKFVFIEHDGIYVPYAVDAFDVKGATISLKFREVNSIGQGEKLKSKFIFLPESEIPSSKQEDLNAPMYSELINYQVIIAGKKIGHITDIEQYPQQEIAKVVTDGKTHLIPLNEDFISRIDHGVQTLYLTLPDGMLEL